MYNSLIEKPQLRPLCHLLLVQYLAFVCIKVCPHLYANANEACKTEANPNECQRVGCLAFTQLNIHPALRMYFSLKYQFQTDSIWLFIEHSPQKRIMFAAPRLHVHINISLIPSCLIRRSCTDVDAALYFTSHMVTFLVCLALFVASVKTILSNGLSV